MEPVGGCEAQPAAIAYDRCMHNDEPAVTEAPPPPAPPEARTTTPLLLLAAEPDLACTDEACLPAEVQPT